VVEVGTEETIHETLEDGGCVGETEGHVLELEVTTVSREGSLKMSSG
jgi:hypothetical protein